MSQRRAVFWFVRKNGTGTSSGFGTMPNWDMRLITTMKGLFNSNSYFNGNLSAWNTSSVTDMSEMFQGAVVLVNPKI